MKLSEIEHGDKVLVDISMKADFWEALGYIQNELNMSQQANFNQENDIAEIMDFDEETCDDDIAIIDATTLEVYLDAITNKNFALDYNEFIAERIITPQLEAYVEHLEDRELICVVVKYPKALDPLLKKNLRALQYEGRFGEYLQEHCSIDTESLAAEYAEKELQAPVIKFDHKSGDEADGMEYYDEYYTYVNEARLHKEISSIVEAMSDDQFADIVNFYEENLRALCGSIDFADFAGLFPETLAFLREYYPN